MTEDRKVKMYVLTNVMKFNRKIYSMFGINIGRALPVRSLLYFLAGWGTIFVWRHFPILKYLVLWMPMAIAYIAIPAGIAWLLSGVPTEDRKPIAFFRSFFKYYLRKRRGFNFYRGKLVPKPVDYRFKGHPTFCMRKNDEIFKVKQYKLRGYTTYKKEF